MAGKFISHLPNGAAMRALAKELEKMPDHSEPAATGEKLTIAELIQSLRKGTSIGLEFLAERKRAEETLKGLGKK